MSGHDLAFAPVSELSRLVHNKEVSPVELTRATLERIDRSQPVLNAFITVCHDRAVDEARAAEQAVMRGDRVGPLHGIPFSVKDTIATAGVRTTSGSLIFKDHIPDRDAVAVARAKAAGGILVGKTTTPEFAFLGLTEAPLFGRTRNAWSAERTSGGSSGGAAVAVAAGLGPVAIATDAGGSARIPAACNGVVGMKASLGTVPHDWADDGFSNMQYLAPIARTVLDAAIMLDVMAGPDSFDPLSVSRVRTDHAAAARAGGDLKGRRVQWRAFLGNTSLASEVRAACESAIGTLADLGAETSEGTGELENAEKLISVVNASYRRKQYGALIEQHRDKVSPSLLRQFQSVSNISADELWGGLIARTSLYRRVQAWFEHADLIVTPTLSRTALPIDQDFFGPIDIDGALTDTPRRAWYPYTIPFNASGNPAISVPCGWSSDGLPIGLQIVGALGADGLVLRAAALFEQARPWADRRPALPDIYC